MRMNSQIREPVRGLPRTRQAQGRNRGRTPSERPGQAAVRRCQLPESLEARPVRDHRALDRKPRLTHLQHPLMWPHAFQR